MDATPGRDGRHMDDIPWHCHPRDTENIMDLLILYRLLNELTDEKRDLEASLLVTDDPARQDDLAQRLHQIIPILAEVRGEVVAREMPGARSTCTAQEFETHLHRVLKLYGRMMYGRMERGRSEGVRQTA